MAKNEAKIKFTAETGEFNDAIKRSNDQMSELRAEMKLNETQMKNTGQSVEGLERKHKLLQDQFDAAGDKVEALANKLRSAEKYFGTNSTEASRLRTQLSNARTAQEKLRGAVSDCANELKDFDKKMEDAGDAAKTASDGFDTAKVAVGNFISDAIQAGLNKVSEFIGYLRGLPEETREARRGMAILGTSFDEAGLSAEQGKEIVRDLYGVLGDNDRAVEASTLIAKMAHNQQDLNDWTLISTGIFGSYGESLPVEALAEAANETSKTGTVTGALADALNWSSDAAAMFSKYMSEDVTTAEDAFNVALSKCTTEQERQALITDTLTALYGDAATKYKETAGSMIEANTAAYDLSQTENKIAESIEPVTTAWDGLKNQLLTASLPAIEKVSDALMDGMAWLKEHPTVLQAVTAAFSVLAVGLGVITAVWAAYTVVQLAANAAMLPIIGIAVAVVAGIALVVAAGVALWQNWDTVKEKCSEVWDNVKNKMSSVFNSVRNTTVRIWNKIKNAITSPIEKAKETISNVVTKIKEALNFEWSIPKPKLPHFSVSGGQAPWGFMGKGSLPKVSVDWYAKGGIMTDPTIFGFNGSSFMGGGDAGPEAILPIDKLEGYISDVMDRKLGALNLDALADSIEALASRPINVNVDGRKIAVATSGYGDSVNGLRSTFKSRGLALD